MGSTSQFWPFSAFPFSGIPPVDPRCGPPPPVLPAGPPRYVIPGSHTIDPRYTQIPRPANQWVSGWPFPREPWPFESETRAPGTGLLSGPVVCSPFQPCPPPPCPPPPSPPLPFRSSARSMASTRTMTRSMPTRTMTRRV